VLGSGSAGNATLLADGPRAVLIDAGLSCRQVVRRLQQVGRGPADVGAIVITHAHGDHTRGAGVFSRVHDVPVYTTAAVRAEWSGEALADWRELTRGPQEVCGFSSDPIVIPHDASETVAFRIETSEGAIGYATDNGAMTRPQV